MILCRMRKTELGRICLFRTLGIPQFKFWVSVHTYSCRDCDVEEIVYFSVPSFWSVQATKDYSMTTSEETSLVYSV